MPNLRDRPYVGTWEFNNRPVVKHTPDMLIFVNGDTAIPGCTKCNGRIEIQRFVKSVTIEAGVTPGAHSGQAQLTIPRNYGEQLFREGRGLLQPSLEVHVYMRGYFPTQGQFAHIPENELQFGGASPINLDRFVAYPYYHVFHGVVTNVNYEYADGFYSASMSFASLLHFWQYHNMTMNGQFLGARPKNSKVNPSLKGNWFNNMSPFAIIYSLYRDLVGAAGLQGYALKSKNNFDAVSEVAGGGKQLYSFMLKYWEERFKTTIQNLRMYGVNGRLFNAVEQAFLVRRNKGGINKDLFRQAHHMASAALYNVRDFSSAAPTIAKELGFQARGDDFVYGLLPNDPNTQAEAKRAVRNTTGFNVLGVSAFTQSLNDLGNIQIFESTYQTKLDVAQTAAQAINYEFYQDVDGDLVFKPPFYNLDTRSNRVYRIEDIDVISFSAQEKEPEATFVTITAGHFNNLKDTGTEGWVGNRGTYYDYRLIAKFGWRPATEEVTYMNKAKQLFYLAQARLDLLNIDINSATVTIPLRPEIRPGFPVYVNFIDCYYYVTAISHSFGFGAQCTTTLTLTARRAKFHAPGFIGPLREGENAIGRIALDRPDLPERPMEVYKNGLPRFHGFPNVVMALDPNKLNPKFFILKSGLEDLSTVDDVKLLFNIIREQVKSTGEGGGIFALNRPSEENAVPTEHTEYRLQQSDDREDDIVFSLSDLIRDFKSLDQARKEVASLERRLARKASDARSARGTKVSKIESELASTTAQLESAREKVELVRDPDKNKLAQLISALQQVDPVRRLGIGTDVKDGPTTAAYLEVLGDLKSNLELRNAPGYYRYFSCSHPDPNQQGQAILEFNDGSGSDLFDVTEAPSPAATAAETLGAPTPKVPEGPIDSQAVKTFGVGFDITDEKEMRRKRQQERAKSFEQKQREHRVLANKMEAVTGVKGLSTFLQAAAQVESARFRAGSFSANRTDSERDASCRTFLGQEVKAGQQTTCPVTPNLSGKRAKRYQEQFNRQPGQGEGVAFSGGRHRSNPHLYDANGNILPNAAERWAFGSGGYYGLFPSTGMGAFRTNTGSKYANLPPESIFDPVISNVMIYNYLANVCRGYAGRAKRDDGKVTWADMRRAMGAYSQLGSAEIGEKRVDRTFKRSLKGKRDLTTGQVVDPDEFAATEVDCAAFLNPGLGRIGRYDRLLDLMAGNRSLEVSPKKIDPPAPPPPTAEPQKPTIRKIEQKLPAVRIVEGFVDGPLETPPGITRSPEAQLGNVVCENGFRVLQAGRKTPLVVPTSDIQQFSFAQFEGVKRTDVLGFSKDKGNYSPKALQKFLTKYLKQRFKQASEQVIAETDPGEVTPTLMIGDVYTEIRDLLLIGKGSTGDKLFADLQGFDFDPESHAYPIYFRRLQGSKAGANDRFQVEELKVVELPTFDQAVPEVEIKNKQQDLEAAAEQATQGLLDGAAGGVDAISSFNPDIAIEIDIGARETVPVSDQVLTVLKAARRYASRKGKIDQTIDKIINDYTKTVVTFVVRAFKEARESAGFQKGKLPNGFSDRMRPIMDAFNQIAFDITQVPFQIEKGKFVNRAPKSVKTRRPLYTPVYPVSDGAGYEHVGAFRYGRGLTVDKGGTFDLINTTNDPLNGLSAESAESFLIAMTQVINERNSTTAGGQALRARLQATQEALRQQVIEADAQVQKIDEAAREAGGAAPETAKLRDARVARYAQLKVVMSRLAEVKPSAVREIAAINNIDPDVLVVEDPNPDQAARFVTTFANTPATGTSEAVMKTTVTNAAFNLADLSAHITDEVNVTCSCRGSDASVLLSAFGRNDFIALDGIDPNEDPATAFVSEGILEGLQDFQFQRQALRGQALDTEGSDLFEKFRQLKDIRNNIRSAGSQIRSLGSEFKRTAQSIGDISLGGG